MTEFFKLSGAGNDFLALVEPAAQPGPENIRAWCARGLSLGADGLLLLRRQGDGAAMEYFNADGRPAALCLNGTRCAARLAFELGWAREEVEIATGAGPVHARRAGPTSVALRLPPPAEPRAIKVEAGDTTWDGWWVEAGVSHFVLPWPRELAAAPVETAGPLLRRHPEFGPAGANVDFARFGPGHRLELRSFERGVEAETLACGTGVMAATAVGLASGRLRLPAAARTRGGFVLEVARDGALWSLTGDARLLARGILTAEAGEVPAPGG